MEQKDNSHIVKNNQINNLSLLAKNSDKKLGRGLSALLGDNKIKPPLLNNENNELIEKINIQKIHAGIYQPRRNFDENELKELAESIQEHGVIQPIILRKAESDNYEIIAGERRFRAAKIANLTEIPAIVKKFSNHQALEVAIIENVQRADLSVTEEATGYKRLIEEFNYTQEIIAKKVGKSRSHIANLMRLLNLPQKVLNYLDEKIISMGHARAIINSSNPEEFAEKIIENNLTVGTTEEMVREEKITKITKKPLLFRTESKIKFINNDQLIAIEKQIAEILDLECKISYNGLRGIGKISLKFSEIEKLQKLLEKIQN